MKRFLSLLFAIYTVILVFAALPDDVFSKRFLPRVDALRRVLHHLYITEGVKVFHIPTEKTHIPRNHCLVVKDLAQPTATPLYKNKTYCDSESLLWRASPFDLMVVRLSIAIVNSKKFSLGENREAGIAREAFFINEPTFYISRFADYFCMRAPATQQIEMALTNRVYQPDFTEQVVERFKLTWDCPTRTLKDESWILDDEAS